MSTQDQLNALRDLVIELIDQLRRERDGYRATDEELYRIKECLWEIK